MKVNIYLVYNGRCCLKIVSIKKNKISKFDYISENLLLKIGENIIGRFFISMYELVFYR